MEIIKEKMITGYPNTITYECTKKIIEQMENNICKIKIGEVQGTGFFCTIPFPNKNKKLNVMMTNNHVINDKLLYSCRQHGVPKTIGANRFLRSIFRCFPES